jgi:quercetin dioxygenase-like cupin family protein
MIENKYSYTLTDTKTIERIVSDENVDINHMVLGPGEALPEHDTNSNVHMIVVRGAVTLRLDDQEPHTFPAGSIIAIPYRTHMNASNTGESIMEIFVIKAPSPSRMK